MEHNKPKRLRHGNCLQKILFWDILELFWIGNNRSFKQEDFRQIDEKFLYNKTNTKFMDYFESERKKNKSIQNIFFKYFSFTLTMRIVAELIICSLIIILPLILKEILIWVADYLDDSTTTSTFQIKKLIFFLFLSLFIKNLLLMPALFNVYGIMVNSSSIFLSLFFGKLKTLDPRAKKHLNLGELSNNLTSDLFRIQISFALFQQLIAFPIAFIMLNIFLVYLIDAWVMLAFFVFFVAFILVVIMGTKIGKLTKTKMGLIDLRNKEVAFALQGIQNVKLNGWESVVSGRIESVRLQEKQLINNIQFLKSMIDILVFVMPTISGFICISIYKYIGQPLGIPDSFLVLTSFGMMTVQFKNFCTGLIFCIDSHHSFKRLEFLLDLPDKEMEVTPLDSPEVPKGTILFENFSASYQDLEFNKKILKSIGKFQGEKSKKYQNFSEEIERQSQMEDSKVQNRETEANAQSFKLSDINFKANPGEITMIVGAIGSGKSSLLKSILNNLHSKAGKLVSNGSLAYIPQNSVLINETVKQNIIFGHKEDSMRYKETIKLAQLKSDLSILPGGDRAEIGERGINLSGGQKQRVSIARAFYSDSDIYLIDDALSALDYDVGKTVFDEMIVKNLLKNQKTVVMTSHLLQYLPQADNILYMENGKVLDQGKFQDLKKNKKFAEFVMQKEEEQKKENDNKQNFDDSNDEEVQKFNERASIESEIHLNSDKNILHGKLLEEEKIFEGGLKKGLFSKFISLGGKGRFALLVITLLLMMTFKISSDFWIGIWICNIFNMSFSAYLLIYFGLVSAILLFGLFRSLAWSSFSDNLCFQNFKQLVENVLKKPMQFFNTTSLGQILNLTGNDVEVVESILIEFGNYLATLVLMVFGTFVLSIFANFFLTPLIAAMIILFYLISNLYLSLAQELRRHELKSQSPIISKIVEVFEGSEQFYVYQKFDWQEESYAKSVDKLAITQIHLKYSGLCFNLYVEILSQFFIVATMIGIVTGLIYKFQSSNQSTTVIAVTVSWLFNIPNFLFMFAFCYCEFVQYMSSFERTVFTIDSEISEKPDAQYEKLPTQANWPSEGKIEIKNVKCRYRDNQPLVLDGISFDVKPNEKVAIVGRTGAGKSSLMLMFSRILEIENNPNFPPIAKSQKINPREDEYCFEKQNIIIADTVNEDDFSIKNQFETDIDTKQKNLIQDDEQNEDDEMNLIFSQILNDKMLHDPEKIGYVKIDGEDITSLNLDVLRKSISVIPQFNLILSGNLRINIDPKNEISDQDIIQTLRNFEVFFLLSNDFEKKEDQEIQKQAISNISNEEYEKLLQMEIEENGNNLSMGQKQLICILRALVKKPKILLLDEATSNIDQLTDQKIQNILKKECKNTTLITIAHRIETIVHYDRIFVLEKGKLIESGSPLELLEQKGNFYKMVSKNGLEFETKIRKLIDEHNA